MQQPYRTPPVCERCKGRGTIEEWDGMGGFDEEPCPECTKNKAADGSSAAGGGDLHADAKLSGER